MACLLPLRTRWTAGSALFRKPIDVSCRLAGRLSVAQVPELLGACAESLPVQLDLTDLVSADAAGIEALQRLRGKGATLYGAPGYIQLKLDSPARHEASAPRQAVAPKKADPHKKVER